MTDWARHAMQDWARERGLSYEERGLLPAATDTLQSGLGAGEHRAGIVRASSAHSITTVGGFTKRPERDSTNLCRGRLPGGLDGIVAHHVSLAHGYSNLDGWTAVVDTVVYARLPEGSRVGRDIQGGRSRPAAIGRTITLNRHRAPDPEIQREEHHGYAWSVAPPGPPSVLQSILAGGVGAALAAAPEGTRIEFRDGVLCVAVRGTLEDPAELDGLCEVAASFAAGVRRAAASLRALDPTAPIGPPEPSPERAWIDEGVRSIEWPQPPASAPEAMAAYAEHERRNPHVKRAARTLRAIVAVGGLLVALTVLGVDLLLLRLTEATAAELGVVAVVEVMLLVPGTLLAARRMARDAKALDVGRRSVSWGLEAFAREYARTRGLALEDRDEFRRRFDSPIPGAPLKVMFGSLGGARGRLVLWVDRTDHPAPRFWNLAVVPRPAVIPHLASYRTEVRGDVLIVAEEVPSEGRSLDRLDALSAAVARTMRAAAPARRLRPAYSGQNRSTALPSGSRTSA